MKNSTTTNETKINIVFVLNESTNNSLFFLTNIIDTLSKSIYFV